MPTPYKQQAQDKLWTLLEAHAGVTALVPVGNRLKQTGDGWLRRVMGAMPNDFPRIEITNGRFTNSGWTQSENQTYAAEQAVTDLSLVGDAVIRRRCEFKIVITGRDPKSTSIDPLEEEVQLAILKGGPRLGLSFVVPFGVLPMDAEQKQIDERGTQRLQSTITQPVLMEFLYRDLIT